MEAGIPAEDVQEFEAFQLERFAELNIEPTDYSDRKYQNLVLTSDFEGFSAIREGNAPVLLPGSKFDNPAYRRKLSRIGKEFLAMCEIKIDVPLFGMWPSRSPGGLYGRLPESGRALVLFTEGGFSYFQKLLRVIAKACPINSEGFDSKDQRVHGTSPWTEAPGVEEGFASFREAILDLLIADASESLREELGLPIASKPKEFILPTGEVHWEELDKGFCAQSFDDQCFRFLLGHEFGHILIDSGHLECVDQIPPIMVTLRGDTRTAYNTEINCDLVGAEFALKYAKAAEVPPELGYSGVWLFFYLWHLTCQALWKIQAADLPYPSDPIYLRHPPTLIRAHYAYDIMRSIYNDEEASRAVQYVEGLKSVLDLYWTRLIPTLDDLRTRGLESHLDSEIRTLLNPAFAGPFYRGS